MIQDRLTMKPDIQDDDEDIIIVKKGRGFKKEAARTGINTYESLDVKDKQAVPTRSVEGWIIIVRNIHSEVHEDDIRDSFLDFGKIKNLHMNLERRTGYIKGYAFIEYGSQKEAKIAIEEMDGKDINGQTLKVDWTFMRGPIM